MGSALLFGSGLAAAQDTRIQLDGVGSDDESASIVYAQETLPTVADATTGRRALSLPGAVHLTVKPRRAINANEEVYLRIDLSGAYFTVAPTLAQGALNTATTPPEPTTGVLGDALADLDSSGGAGHSFWIAKLGAADAGATVGSGNLLSVVIASAGTSGGENDLSMATTSGNVTATITSYGDPDDAYDEVNATPTFGGSAAIIKLVSGLSVTISPADNPVASVDQGFLWFLGPVGQAPLGWLGVEEKIAADVYNANNGLELADGIILPAAAKVGFNVMGNLDIGAFSTKKEVFEMEDDGQGGMQVKMVDGARVPTETCGGVDAGSVDQGTLEGSDGMKLISEEGDLPSGVDAASTGNLNEGVYLLCLNVDVTGPETNMNPIPEGDYSATAYMKATATSPAVMVGEAGDLASIERNGASVDIPYLTTSEKHNQRLIIVNRGTRAVAITSIQFTTEDDVDAKLMAPVQAALDAGLLVIPANSSYVRRMDETITITYSGDTAKRRTAASIAFAGTSGAISVATTQVNVSDGSTDTVVYRVD